ncbi:hypothetical protein HYW21_04310 [Candidatus Woesearchaeota archaeon]|nr:hypothetical protein [Candidatus Woesearchaeota archaeon]
MVYHSHHDDEPWMQRHYGASAGVRAIMEDHGPGMGSHYAHQENEISSGYQSQQRYQNIEASNDPLKSGYQQDNKLPEEQKKEKESEFEHKINQHLPKEKEKKDEDEWTLPSSLNVEEPRPFAEKQQEPMDVEEKKNKKQRKPEEEEVIKSIEELLRG